MLRACLLVRLMYGCIFYTTIMTTLLYFVGSPLILPAASPHTSAPDYKRG